MNHFAASPPNRKILFGIILAAIVMRLGVILLFHPPVISDAKEYDAIARSLVRGDGFNVEGNPTAYRLPGYPLLLAAAYGVFGDSDLPIKILQALADVLSCFLLFSIGKKLFSEKIGLTAAAILAVFPIQVLYVPLLMTETIFTTILLLIVWVAVVEDVPAQFIILGVLTGLGMLLRSTAACLPFVIFLNRWRCSISFRTNVRSLIVIAAAALITVSPWIARNYIQFHTLSFTSNGGVNFWIGNHHGANGTFSFPKENNPLEAAKDEFDRSQLGYKLGFEFIATHPFELVVLEGKKVAHFFAADYWLLMVMDYKPEWASLQRASAIYSQFSPADVIVLHLPYVVVILVGTFGLVCPAGKDEKKFFFLRSLLLFWLTMHLIFYAGARYRFPVVPIFILAAAYAWYVVRENSFQRTKLRLLLFAFLCLLYFAGWLGEYFMVRSKAAGIQSVTEQVLIKNLRNFDPPNPSRSQRVSKTAIVYLTNRFSFCILYPLNQTKDTTYETQQINPQRTCTQQSQKRRSKGIARRSPVG
ncbi:MAG: glycosyltransferase family 39 protein [Bacteroidota bacterium]